MKEIIRTRVVLTNGRESRELLWISHHESNIYWGGGSGHLAYKVSHHASGKRYHQSRGKTIMIEPVPQPNILKGYFSVLTLGSICNPSRYTIEQAPKFKGSKLDAVFMVDTRSLPKRGENNIRIGMIESGRFDVFSNLLRRGTQTSQGEKVSFKILQTLLITSCTPWIVLSLDNLEIHALE